MKRKKERHIIKLVYLFLLEIVLDEVIVIARRLDILEVIIKKRGK